ncbi:unnamed protein product [Pleuronectes platessa]|uniref:Protein CASC3 n=1 Tax=Pleuronectes platessa TaxID=8262 RepID=A0A9N7YAJ4_PLEPL|nr:unnamed protein product [Pleuronectes platessa]
MADRRRRRRRASQDSEDDDGSGSGSDSGRSASPTTKSRAKEPEPAEVPVVRPEAKNNVESECESEDGVGEAVLSDYESADPEDNGSHSEGVEEEEEAESDEEAPAAAAASESEPPAPSDPAPGEEGEQVEDNEEQQQEEEEEEEEEEEQQQQQQQQQQQEEQQEEEPEREDGGERTEESKAEEKENLSGERQSGDGQESTDDPETKVGGTPGQKLDDDEDRKNPAYIPRKGLFFEHDVRGHAQEEERPKGRKGRLWKDEGRWEHDKFREEEQAPKSREELIAIYGYDIRNGGGPGDRSYRQRRPRQSVSPSRDKRWKEGGGERAVRSWQGGGGDASQRETGPDSSVGACRRQGCGQQRRAWWWRKGGPYLVIENSGSSQPGVEEKDLSSSAVKPFQSASPRRQQKEQRGGADRSVSGAAASTSDPPLQSSSVANREASPPTERPVERKSYALARRTRSRPTDLGSKQPSVDETTVSGNASSPVSAGGRSWTGDAPGQTGSGGGGGGELAELDADVARLSLAGQSWNQSPTSYIRSEMRDSRRRDEMFKVNLLLRGFHVEVSTSSRPPQPPAHPRAPPQFSSMEEMGVATNRAKRYSSQRQRAVPEPAPPMHLGVMDGHYYEPMSYQGPIYAHGDGPPPIPPQGMLVQPEMHLPHPGLHPHQSGAPIANPALYAGPPVSLSPGQPQQLLPPPFYPPPGVMTFPYPAMYPTPQAQAQVTYGGVTYYDTMQQQAQPKPSPPRRTSQPVTVKPPPPEVPFASESGMGGEALRSPPALTSEGRVEEDELSIAVGPRFRPCGGLADPP